MSAEAERVEKLFLEVMPGLDPEFGSRCEGAENKRIEKLEKRAGRPLPDAYRVFLKHAGERFDIPMYKSDVDIKTLRSTYKKSKWRVPRPYMLFGVAWDDPYHDLWLQEGSDGALGVLRFPKPYEGETLEAVGDYTDELGPSFSEVLYVRCFLECHLNLFPATVAVGARHERENYAVEGHRVLKDLGFQRSELSGPWRSMYTRPGASVLVQHRTPDLLNFQLGAKDGQTMRSLAGEFEHRLGMQIAGSR